MANAFAYTHSDKRHNLVGMIRGLPVPDVAEAEVHRVSANVDEYLCAVAEDVRDLAPPANADVARRLMLQIDAAVLSLYDLPPRLERQLLDLFAGWSRQGVSFALDSLLPRRLRAVLPFAGLSFLRIRRVNRRSPAEPNKT